MLRQEWVKITLVVVGTALVAALGTLALSATRTTEKPSTDRADSAVTSSPEALDAGAAQPKIEPGNAEVDTAASELRGKPPVATTEQTTDGAVEAFVSASQFILASPASEADAQAAIEGVSTVLNDVDEQMLARFDRKEGVTFSPLDGSYRVLAISGPERRPAKVMLEVLAPLTVGDVQRWAVVGGVIAFVDGQWQIESIRPSEPIQPRAQAAELGKLTDADRARVLGGKPGWLTFANADG